MSNILKLYRPVRPFLINQRFGDDLACIEDRNDIPDDKKKVIARVGDTCKAGYTSLYKKVGLKGHSGLDLYARHGQPVYYAGPDGFVHEICTEEARGLGVGCITNDAFTYIDGNDYRMKTRYWHLLTISVKKGDKISTGDLIGYADNTGYSAGDHLHFELKPQIYNGREPFGDYVNAFQSNGYYGGVDPLPYLSEEYADKFTYQFKNEMSYGDKSEDVKRLQEFLQREGYFPISQTCTGYYGKITANSVYNFQTDNMLLSAWESVYLRGRFSRVGQKTLKRLRELIG